MTPETLRHWRSALASLAGLTGHAPVFRPGQLLGIAVVRVLVEELGVGVSTLKAVDRDIFAICSTPQWIRLAGGYLLIRPSEGTAKFVDRLDDGALFEPGDRASAGIGRSLVARGTARSDARGSATEFRVPTPRCERASDGNWRAGMTPAAAAVAAHFSAIGYVADTLLADYSFADVLSPTGETRRVN